MDDYLKIKSILLKIAKNNEIIYVPISNKNIEPYQKFTHDMISPLLEEQDISKICDTVSENIYVYQPKNIINIKKIRIAFKNI